MLRMIDQARATAPRRTRVGTAYDENTTTRTTRATSCTDGTVADTPVREPAARTTRTTS